MKIKFASWNNVIAYTISLLIMGEVINDFLSFMLKSDNVIYRLIMITGFLSVYIIIYIKYFKIHKLIIEDIMILFLFGVIYILFNFFFIMASRSFFVYFLILLIILYIISKKQLKINYFFSVFLIFSIIVLLNVIILGYYGNYATFKIKYFLINTVFPCIFVMFLANKENLHTAKLYIMSYSIITLVFSSIGYISGIGLNEIGLLAILGGDKIVTSFALGSVFIIFFFQVKKRNHVFNNIIIIAFIGLIGFLMMIAGARGPVVSLILTITIFLIRIKNLKHKTIIIISLLLLGSITYTDYFEEFSEKNIGVGRIEQFIIRSEGQTNIDEESSGRINIYKETVKEFEDNIFLGKGIGKNEMVGWYPHNSILEILSQVGILGFIPFLLLILMWIYHFIKTDVGYNDKFNVYKYLFLYTFFESLFSGSIFMNVTFWVLLIINGIIFKFQETGNYKTSILKNLIINNKK